MAGALNWLTDPANQGLLNLSAGLLQASGPSLRPVSFGQALGQGMQQGTQAYQQAQQLQNQTNLQKLHGDLYKMQAGLLEAQTAAERRKAAALSGLSNFLVPPQPQPQPGLSQTSAQAMNAPWAASPGGPITPPTIPNIPVPALAQAAAAGVNIDPFLKLNQEMRPDLKFQDVGNEIVVYDKGREVQRVPKGAAPASVPYTMKDLSPAGARDFAIRERQAGAAQQVTNVNTALPASEEAQKEFMKSTRVNYDALRNAPTALKNIEAAKALIPGAKGFMGPGGEGLLEAAKFLNNRLGTNIDTQGVKDAEELRSRVFFNLMDSLKKMDAQPSEMQQRVMMDALGKLGTDPDALPAVLDAFAEAISGKVSSHNREVQSAIERGVKFPYDPLIQLPKAGGGAVEDAMASMPPAKEHKGRIIEDSAGKRYKSDGMKWQPVK